jgi:hypothetical protein
MPSQSAYCRKVCEVPGESSVIVEQNEPGKLICVMDDEYNGVPMMSPRMAEVVIKALRACQKARRLRDKSIAAQKSTRSRL